MEILHEECRGSENIIDKFHHLSARPCCYCSIGIAVGEKRHTRFSSNQKCINNPVNYAPCRALASEEIIELTLNCNEQRAEDYLQTARKATQTRNSIVIDYPFNLTGT